MPLLYGLHDEEGLSKVPRDGWCVALVKLKDAPKNKIYPPLVNWLVRINWGYGTEGTIPEESELQTYLAHLQLFISTCDGATRFIIGNEPNHEQEWPNGKPISISHYVKFFNAAEKTIHKLVPEAQVIPAATAPYKVNSLGYLHEILLQVQNPGAICLHAYARGADPSAITTEEKMGAPLQTLYSGFRTFLDQLGVVPAKWRHLPAHITEFNEITPEGWVDKNTGIVKAAYALVNHWNGIPSTQKVHSLSLYRWPNYDKWYIEGKQGVLDDFNEAVAKGYLSPVEAFETPSGPILPVEPPKPPSGPENDLFLERSYDPDATAYGVHVEEIPVGLAWRVTKTHRMVGGEGTENGGRRHFYFDTLDENGNRLVGVNIIVRWSTGFTKITSEAKPGEPYSANFPFTPGKGAFSARVIDDQVPSETVEGAGMGDETPSGFNPGIHSSIVVVFQRNRSLKVLPAPQPPPKHLVLARPVTGPITQHFGEGDYSEINDSGVPLRGHTGIDYGVPVGTPVFATASGHVIEIGNADTDHTGFGNYIKLQHLWGESLYAHLSQVLVTLSQDIRTHDQIAFSGNTGRSTGPHLHFGIRINPYNRQDGYAGYSDPEPYFKEIDTPSKLPPSDVLEAIKQAADEIGLDWELLASMAWAESSFNAEEANGGLFQLGEATIQDYADDTFNIEDPLDNARIGARYIKYLLSLTDNNIYRALYAYNFGIGNVLGSKEIPAITKEYANKVVHGRDLLKAIGE
jgi:murein DD-endopeptidase MepM/ murein hydrolase activator NlpD